MDELFEKLQYPFVFVDSSHAFRTSNTNIEKLTRGLLKKSPQKFWSLIYGIENAAREDTPYYEQIIQLQKKGVISTLITCEAINQRIIDSQTDVIHLFGAANSLCLSDKEPCRIDLPDLVLWGENVCYKTYIRATNALLNASCIVADKTILSLRIGQLLLEHTTQHCPIYFLSDRKKGGNHTEYELPPKQFIQQLAFVHRVTD
ncbi:MAG: hypothetical protein IJX01_00325 [Oscillospiraceae bacterium]|nr:hypothetical protein [Oscillospiraceae bacterium]